MLGLGHRLRKNQEEGVEQRASQWMEEAMEVLASRGRRLASCGQEDEQGRKVGRAMDMESGSLIWHEVR
jgi:hypothetical protein